MASCESESPIETDSPEKPKLVKPKPEDPGPWNYKARKAVFIIVDGVPTNLIERLNTPAISDIAFNGSYARAYTGWKVWGYTETPTVSTPDYMSLLTATWAYKYSVKGNSNLRSNYKYWCLF